MVWELMEINTPIYALYAGTRYPISFPEALMMSGALERGAAENLSEALVRAEPSITPAHRNAKYLTPRLIRCKSMASVSDCLGMVFRNAVGAIQANQS